MNIDPAPWIVLPATDTTGAAVVVVAVVAVAVAVVVGSLLL